MITGLTNLEERIDEYNEKNELSKGSAISFCPTTGMSRSKTYEDRKDKLIKRKEQFTKLTIISLGCLFISFFLSIYNYGILTIIDIKVESVTPTLFPLILLAFLFLFIGVMSIFLILYEMGKEPSQ